MRDVIEHVDDGMAFFAEASRVLKSGGKVYLTGPDNQPHVWKEPSHRRPYPMNALEYIGAAFGYEMEYSGYESMARGTQKIARIFGGRTPGLIRLFWYLPWWSRCAVTLQRKK